MSHIVEFSISGLAGRKEDLSIRLNRDVNVFFGINGSGKTSLLKILHSAMNGNHHILREVPFVSARIVIYSIDRDQEYVYTINKASIINSNIDNENDLEVMSNPNKINSIHQDSESGWKVEPKSSDNLTKWHHRYLPTTRLYFRFPELLVRQEYFNVDQAEQYLDRQFAETIRSLWSDCTNRVLSQVKGVQEKGITSIFEAILATSVEIEKQTSLDPETAFRTMKNYFKRQKKDVNIGTYKSFEKKYLTDDVLRKVVADIEKIEQEIETANKSNNNFQKLIVKLFNPNKKILITENNISIKSREDVELGLNTLSSGEKHLIRLFIEAILADESSLMIDEPEISMHIDWQKSFVESINLINPYVQLILVTHSPEIMANLPDNKIFPI